jgi:hypothetical protein
MPNDPLVTDEMRAAGLEAWYAPADSTARRFENIYLTMRALEPAPKISADAIEAALDEWHSGNHWMRAADTAWIAVERERAARAIASADAARGHSHLTWHDRKEFVVTPGDQPGRWVLVIRHDQSRASPAHWSHYFMDNFVVAWAEMPEERPRVAQDTPANERGIASEEYAHVPTAARPTRRPHDAREAIQRYLARWGVHHIHRLEDGKAEFDAVVREVWPE